MFRGLYGQRVSWKDTLKVQDIELKICDCNSTILTGLEPYLFKSDILINYVYGLLPSLRSSLLRADFITKSRKVESCHHDIKHFLVPDFSTLARWLWPSPFFKARSGGI